jgi:PAS domain S-box-containing protein
MVAARPRAIRHIWWIFLAILAADTVLVSLNIARTARNEAKVAHTLRVLNAVNRLQGSLTDSETGARGFLVTGKDEFLEPYRLSQPATRELWSELRELMAGDDQHTRWLDELEPLIQRRLEVLKQTIEARRQTPRDPQREIELVERGKRTMDEIRSRTSKLRTDEEALLDQRADAARGTLTTSIFSAIVGGSATVGMLILTRFLMRREREVRREADESLRQSEERFRLIAESLPQFVWVTAPDGHYEFCNQRWLDYTGLASDKSLGYGWTGPLHPDDRDHFEKLWKHALATGEPFETETRFLDVHGESRWFIARVLPLRNRRGTITRWLGTAGDIDNQKRANEELEQRVRERTAEIQEVVANLYSEAMLREQAADQLRRMTIELQRSNKELEQFAYLASHDLQEPLRKIQAFGDRLKSKFGDQLANGGREYLERMQASATRMRRLIDDLLAFSRVATRPQPFTEVDLNVVAEEVLTDLEDAIERTGASVDIGPLPTIRADALQMRILLQNLLTNALKFHKPGEPPRVTIRAETLSNMPNTPPTGPAQMTVRIDIRDEGIGFEEIYRDRIFEVFQRLHGRHEFEGTGIGLAVVRKIVERHGGQIHAQSTPGEGATFSVYLPLQAPAGSDVRDEPAIAAEP